MKIWCETCEGTGTVTNALCLGSGIRGIGAVQSERCNKCDGKGYTNTPQQILDDLECAEIEREVLSKFKFIDISSFSDLVRVRIGNGEEVLCEFYRTTKLEVLRKAKEWIEWRG